MKKYYLLYIFITSCTNIYSQFNFKGNYVNINNVNASIMNNGGMLFNQFNLVDPNYEFPKGSGKNSTFACNLWIYGFDTNNKMHLSVQYFNYGHDYFTGPLDSNGNYSAKLSNL